MLQITFDFDEKTKTVSNLKVITKTKDKSSTDLVPVLRLDASKLSLSDKLVEELNIAAGERLAVNYVQSTKDSTIFPVIGKASVFSNDNAGNKLTQSNTVSFRGNQNRMLATHGEIFTIEPYSEGIFKLISVSEEEIREKQNKQSLYNLNQFKVK